MRQQTSWIVIEFSNLLNHLYMSQLSHHDTSSLQFITNLSHFLLVYFLAECFIFALGASISWTAHVNVIPWMGSMESSIGHIVWRYNLENASTLCFERWIFSSDCQISVQVTLIPDVCSYKKAIWSHLNRLCDSIIWIRSQNYCILDR
jgi:hypothetical protein